MIEFLKEMMKVMMSGNGGRLLYLSLWCHLLLLGGGKLLLQAGGRDRRRLELLGVSFQRDFLLLLIRV